MLKQGNAIDKQTRGQKAMLAMTVSWLKNWKQSKRRTR